MLCCISLEKKHCVFPKQKLQEFGLQMDSWRELVVCIGSANAFAKMIGFSMEKEQQ